MKPRSTLNAAEAAGLVEQLQRRLEGAGLATQPEVAVRILNLVSEPGETSGFSMERHIHMLRQHCPSLRMDVTVVDRSTVSDARERRALERAAGQLGARVIYRDVRADDDRGRWSDRHSPEKLARVLREFAGPVDALPAELPDGAADTASGGEPAGR